MSRLLCALILIIGLAVPAAAGSIPITGTIRLPNGNLLNGSIRLTLSVSEARDTSASNVIVAQRVTFPVQNGAIRSGSRIVPNDVLSPANTVYTAEYFTSTGTKLGQNNFYIQGATFDIGAATPTPLTTSNISFNSFTGLTTISSKNIDNVRKCDQFTGANAGAKIVACLADLPSTGGVADATGIEGAQTISSSITIGANKTVLLGAATYTLSAASFIMSTGSTLKGLGPCRVISSCTTIQRTAGTTSMITATGTAGSGHVNTFTLEGFYLDGGATAGHGIVLDYVDGFRINNVVAGNGGASNALRLLDEAWDFWVTDSLFVVWGDTTNASIQLSGLDGSHQITDGHWYGNQLGEIGNNNPILIANGFVLHQRFVDNKFHSTGGSMVYMVDWSGYRSDFIGCTFQGDTASASAGLFRVKNADNSIIGGEFNDIDFGSAIQISGAGDAIISGVKFRGGGTAAVATTAAATGVVTVTGNQIAGTFARGYDFRVGNNTFSIGPSNIASTVTTAIDYPAAIGSAAWQDFNTAHSTVTIGGDSANSARSVAAGNNPTLSLGGNAATHVAGNQNITGLAAFTGGGQINESIGLASSQEKLSGVGTIDGTNIQHPIVWCASVDSECFGIYTKIAGNAVSSANKWIAFSTSGDLIFAKQDGQHIETFSATNDISGKLTLSGGAQTYTFAVAYGSAPVCVVSSTTANHAYGSATTTTLTVNGTGSDVVNFHCIGDPN